eukprot:759689_1
MQRLDHLLDVGICKGIPQDFVPLIAEINGILSLRCYHYVSHQTNQEYIVMISHRALIMYDVMNDRYNKPIPLYPYPSKHRNPFMHGSHLIQQIHCEMHCIHQDARTQTG